MDVSRRKVPDNPKEKASFVSSLFFLWTYEIFRDGYHKGFNINNICKPMKEDYSSELGDRLERQWKIELEKRRKKNKKPSLLFTILRTFGREYAYLAILLAFTEIGIQLSRPYFLDLLLCYFKQNSETAINEAYYATVGLICSSILYSLLTQHYYAASLTLGMKVRIACASLIYRKCLKLRRTTLQDISPGQVINMLSNDVSRFDAVALTSHYLWSAPLLACLIAIILYREFGWTGFIGVLVVFIMAPLLSYVGKLSSKYQLQIALKSDKRVHLMDEVVKGILVLKMYAWEKPFAELVADTRKAELDVLQKKTFLRGLQLTLNLIIARVALLSILLAIVLQGEHIVADKVFVIATYIAALTQVASSTFTRGFSDIFECRVAIRRLQNFLMQTEYKSQVELNYKNKNGKVDDTGCMNKILIKDVSASWYPNGNDPPTLNMINCTLKEGTLTGIIGSIGSGKSSFLQLLLGEIEVLQGYIAIQGSVSYASQEAWVFSGSVRQNILFGQSFDRKRYKEVIKICALEQDFKLLQNGDKTLVGERGASLSGGQKARVNLARAVYKDADIYLFDDPLSAVDTHVSKHLFNDCIKGYLANKTVILVTHQLQYISSFDHVILLHNGSIEKQGSFKELRNSGLDYASLDNIGEEKDHISDSKHEEISNETKIILESSQKGSVEIQSNFNVLKDNGLDYTSLVPIEKKMTESISELEHKEISEDTKMISKTLHEGSVGMQSSFNELKDSVLDSALLVSAEEKITDSISESEHEEILEDTKMIPRNSHASTLSVFSDILELEPEGFSNQGKSICLSYLRAGSNMCFLFISVLSFIFTQAIGSCADYFVSYWAEIEEFRYNSQNATSIHDDMWSSTTLASIESTLIAGVFIFGLTRTKIFCAICTSSSKELHNKMFNSVIRTPISFFNNNPSGRILNRFSKDLNMVDEWLPKYFMDFIQFVFCAVGSILIAVILNPVCIIPAAILSAICIFIRKLYVKTSINLNRLEGIARSPVFSHLNSTLQGLPTVRALGAQSILQSEFDNHQDLHSSTVFLLNYTSSGFSSFLDLICSVFISCVAFSTLAFTHDDVTGGVASAGLALSQAISISTILQWIMRGSVEINKQMTSAERVLEYANLPSEEPNSSSKKGKDDIDNWPTEGKIEINRLCLYYSNSDSPVLKNICIEIKPHEKVGIVGRTGAGKSSLVQALFRMTDITGQILIDGIDTKTLTLECLRSHISIIPQDPVIYSGTMRHNLDPFEKYPDYVLWQALDEVELKNFSTEEYDLQIDLKGGGSNFSVGQRQLICLARAIVRNNKILVMDEATANVDPHTDSLIQKTVRNKFSGCTVLTIAHRLNTIMDSDRVLVMDAGEAVEFDHPHILLQDINGYFYKLVQETGPAMAEQLAEIAKMSYLQR
ncbi:ATP-binding cassette sub-family C member 4-like [Lycorma delicatula]|uniref:ATP-binding cassette sub-family C member 4-like n=1 Tax=Lycorma delicatula TaxID=130591 RepID=UPI003F5198EC